MSFGGPEDSGQTADDFHFTTPAGHAGVSFFAATGDTGSYDPNGTHAPEYPATSPNVVAIGGTTLSVAAGGAYVSESGWGSGTNSYVYGGGGGGISTVESQPAYQQGVVTQSTTRRTTPDVSILANPASAVAVYDSYDNGTSTPWTAFGGTSLGTPAWAGLVSVANQGPRAAGPGRPGRRELDCCPSSTRCPRPISTT